MKKIILFIFVLIGCCSYCWSQTPYEFSYQASVRDASGKIVANKDVTIILSILQGSDTGNVIFTEQQRVHTNTHGVFSLNIGSVESMRQIDWGNGSYYLKVEIDPQGGNNYSLSSTQQLLSVPYALNVKMTDSIAGFDYKEKQVLSMSNDTIYLTGGSYAVLPDGFDGDYNHLTNKPVGLSAFVNDMGYLTDEVQVVRISNDTIYLTGGSFVKLPAGFDGDYNSLINKPDLPTALSQLINDAGFITEEVQVLSISNDTIYLTGGSYVKLPQRPEYQTVGDVAALGNEAGGVQLKNVKDPTDPQDAITLHYLDSVIHDWVYQDEDYGTHNVFITTACDRYLWHGHYYTMDGEYTYGYANASGHYSVDTLKLTIRNSSHQSQHITVPDDYRWHNTLYSHTGTYTYAYENNEGCPSIDTLFLTINENASALCTHYRYATDTATISLCGEATWYNRKIHTSGMYEHNLGRVTADDCDSIVQVNITILPVFQHDTAVRTNTSYTWRGHTYTEQGDYGDTLLASNGCDSIYTLHLMMGGKSGVGATKGLFSVANGLQVRFAQGNLQYQSSSNHWRFAEHQYDIARVECLSAYNSDWADLFGWATSGYHDNGDSLCVNYKPWSYGHIRADVGTDAFQYNQYGYGPSLNMQDSNLVGTSSNYDWGVYNIISNGGNGTGLWRTMSLEEWNYLLYQRANADSLRGIVHLRDVHLPSGDSTQYLYGYILLPDDWICPANIIFNPNNTDDYWGNTYTVEEWEQMEDAGAVLLPMRYMIFGEWDYRAAIGTYWTQTSYDAAGAYSLSMNKDTCILAPYNRSVKSSVRLVQNYTAGSSDCEASFVDTVVVSANNLSWNGHTYTESGEYVDVINNNGCDSVVYLTYIKVESGELNGLFSIDTNRQVKFSKGSLQYNASADVWRFADEQYGFLGDANRFISQSYKGWIDLFGWATSGYHDPTDVLNEHYEPWSCHGYSEFGYGPSVHMSDRNLTNTSANYDWGVYNAIANGGNQVGQWRTLTNEEMDYLLSGRTNAWDLSGGAIVNGIIGYIILPDAWVAPSGIYFNPNEGDSNVYNISQWKRMEAAGAVFFPVNGQRDYKSIWEDGMYGTYWLSTFSDNTSSQFSHYFRVNLNGGAVNSDWNARGFGVRLVKDN